MPRSAGVAGNASEDACRKRPAVAAAGDAAAEDAPGERPTAAERQGGGAGGGAGSAGMQARAALVCSFCFCRRLSFDCLLWRCPLGSVIRGGCHSSPSRRYFVQALSAPGKTFPETAVGDPSGSTKFASGLLCRPKRFRAARNQSRDARWRWLLLNLPATLVNRLCTEFAASSSRAAACAASRCSRPSAPRSILSIFLVIGPL